MRLITSKYGNYEIIYGVVIQLNVSWAMESARYVE